MAMDINLDKNEYNPFHMKNMEDAVQRIIKSINQRKKIVVYGYNDLDSIMAVSLLLLLFRYLNGDIEYFVPGSREVCKGLSIGDIENYIKYFDTDVIITVGCGVDSLETYELCRKYSIDIVTLDTTKVENHVKNVDNHNIIINPNQDGCSYPFKELSISGVAFKFAEAISDYYKMTSVNKYLDLVTIGTISSKVQVSGENEFIIHEGMEKIKETNNYGIKAFLYEYNNSYKIKYAAHEFIDILSKVFSNCEDINVSRIIVELLTTCDSYRAKQISKYLYREMKRNLL